MSIAFVIIDTCVLFLPVVREYSYSTVLFIFAALAVIYFLTAIFLLPNQRQNSGRDRAALEGIRKYSRNIA
ncbi:hypothetical protein RBB75_06390 [Tunturibacter empetritectus]|uniref:Uncharacterized protein n=1 Tax=Tunturiibacter empetritectus TaxID=3069691 RepID=A0AAU7ZH81_9BACT